MKNIRDEYCEEIEKNTKYRGDYVDGVLSFLENRQSQMAINRAKSFTPANYKGNEEAYRSAFRKMLGFPLLDEHKAACLKEKIFVARDKNVNIYRMTLLIKDSIPFYGIYFEQIEKSDDTPFVLALHGALGTPELISGIYQNSSNYNHIVRRITERGANVFVPQLLLWNVDTYGNAHIPRQEIDGKLRQLGGSLTALELCCLQSTIDYFLSQENANKNHMGVVGLSYGGMYALHLAALDTRLKACYSCSWFSDGFEYAWAEWSYKDAQIIASSVETAALVAPRCLVIAMGDKDSLFDYRKTVQNCQFVEKFYEAYGCSDCFKYVIFDGGHEFNKSDKELEFFFNSLK